MSFGADLARSKKRTPTHLRLARQLRRFPDAVPSFADVRSPTDDEDKAGADVLLLDAKATMPDGRQNPDARVVATVQFKDREGPCARYWANRDDPEIAIELESTKAELRDDAGPARFDWGTVGWAYVPHPKNDDAPPPTDGTPHKAMADYVVQAYAAADRVAPVVLDGRELSRIIRTEPWMYHDGLLGLVPSEQFAADKRSRVGRVQPNRKGRSKWMPVPLSVLQAFEKTPLLVGRLAPDN
jgi:hypothetical protein